VDEAADWANVLAIRSAGAGAQWYSVLSHLAFVPFLVRAAWLRNYVGFSLIALTTAISTLYHWCAAFDRCEGQTLQTLRASDHLTASLAIVCVGWLALMAIGTRPSKTRQMAHVMTVLPIQIVAVSLATIGHPIDTLPSVVAIITVALSFGVFFLFFRAEPYEDARRRQPTKIRLHWPLVVGGLLLSAIAVMMFVFPDQTSVLHSTWHVFVALGLETLQEGTYFYNKS